MPPYGAPIGVAIIFKKILSSPTSKILIVIILVPIFVCLICSIVHAICQEAFFLKHLLGGDTHVLTEKRRERNETFLNIVSLSIALSSK